MSSLPWYIARSAGLVGWALLTASVIWGLLISTRASVRGRRPRPAWTLDLHRYLGGLATVFTIVHILGVLADKYVPFSISTVLMPFASTWRRGAIAWGVVALYALVAVELTSLARRRLPRKLWRLTHFASFPLFVAATVHAFTAGTDAHTWMVEGAMAAAVLAVGSLTALRVRQARTPVPPTSARPAPARPSPAVPATAMERLAALERRTSRQRTAA